MKPIMPYSPTPWTWVQDTGNSISILDADENPVMQILADEEIGEKEICNARFVVAMSEKV